MGQEEGRAFWWTAPPFHFDYEYDGVPYEYSIWNNKCWEADINCVEDGKIWFVWKWSINAVCLFIICCLCICKKIMKKK